MSGDGSRTIGDTSTGVAGSGLDSGDDRAATGREPESSSSTDRLVNVTLPNLVFWTGLVVALALFVARPFPSWFGLDDWDLLATRSARDLGDLVRPHYDHFSATPTLIYRALFAAFGLQVLPFQLVSIGIHLACSVTLRSLLLKFPVRPWAATSGALVFAFFVTGHQNITYAFGMSFGISLLCGLVHLLLVAHPGTWGRRDWIGLAVGAVGVAASGVAVTMVFVVTVALVIRHRMLAAALTCGSLGSVYALWWMTSNSETESDIAGLYDTARFAGSHIWHTYGSFGRNIVAAAIFVSFTVLGLSRAWRRRAAPAPSTSPEVVALVTGAAFYLITSGAATGLAPNSPFPIIWPAPRHLHIVAALLLPSIVVGADAVIRRWRGAQWPVTLVLLVGVPWNIVDFVQLPERDARFDSETVILGTAGLDAVRLLPPETEIEPVLHPGVTAGWLVEEAEAGHISVIEVPNDLESLLTLGLALAERSDTRPVDEEFCRFVTTPTDFDIDVGDQITVGGSDAAISLLTPSGAGLPTRLPASQFFTSTRTVLLGPLRVRVEPFDDTETTSFCLDSS